MKYFAILISMLSGHFAFADYTCTATFRLVHPDGTSKEFAQSFNFWGPRSGTQISDLDGNKVLIDLEMDNGSDRFGNQLSGTTAGIAVGPKDGSMKYKSRQHFAVIDGKLPSKFSITFYGDDPGEIIKTENGNLVVWLICKNDLAFENQK
ncbi:hypothetical protein [Bdellovibrio bacteriovorus]|uniref:hypothetical protein n=1 Tax=Bdellovibrio TaxID=958 RepID=UPI0035A8A911